MPSGIRCQREGNLCKRTVTIEQSWQLSTCLMYGLVRTSTRHATEHSFLVYSYGSV